MCVFEETFPEMLWRIKTLICNEIDKIATDLHFCFQNDQIHKSQVNICFEFVSSVQILKESTSVFVLNPDFYQKQ